MDLPEESRARAGRLLQANQETEGIDWRKRSNSFVSVTEHFFGLPQGVTPETAWLDDAQMATCL